MELFQSSLAINYDTRFLPTAHPFVENLSKLAGASGNERVQLQVALEEVLAYVIEQFPDPKYEHHIALRFTLHDTSDLVLEITHGGPPIHQEFIPEFDVYDDTTVEGLWYKMASSMVDRVDMESLPKAGWLIRLTKKIGQVVFERASSPEQIVDVKGQLKTRVATQSTLLNDLTGYAQAL
jgi:hypothetical protein